MFGLAACGEGGPGFVHVSVRTITNARQVGMRMQKKCAGTHRHARVGASNSSEKVEQSGTWVHQVAQAIQEQLREDQQEFVKQKMQRGCEKDRS